MIISRVLNIRVFPALLLALAVPLSAGSALESRDNRSSEEQASQDRLLVGVLELDVNNVDLGEARAIAERLRVYLAREDLFDVLERSRMESILSEVGFQLSGACSTDECVIQVGKLLGAQKMVAGSVSKVGSLYTLQVRVVDIQTGRIEVVAFADVEGIEEVLRTATRDCVWQLANGVRERMTGVEARQPQAGEEEVAGETGGVRRGRIVTERAGWIVRLNTGAASSQVWAGSGAKLDITKGKTNTTFISIGRTIDSSLMLSLQLWTSSKAGPTLASDTVQFDTPDDVVVKIDGFGFGLTKYYMPSNIYAGASLFFPQLFLDDDRTGIHAESKTGTAIAFHAGKEWWLLRSLSVGISGQLAFGSMEDKGGYSTLNMRTLSLMLSLTWQVTSTY